MLRRHKIKCAENIGAGILVDNSQCGFCGSMDFDILMQYSAEPDIHFMKCKNCGAVTYDKWISQEALDGIYSNYDYHAEDGAQSVTFYGARRFARHLSKYADFKGQDKIRILDFGGGNGALAYFTAQQMKKKKPGLSIEITVVDYCKDLYPSDDDGITMKRTFPVSAVSGEFHLIIASAVIEHLPNPAADIKKIFSCLQGGGIAYFRTPYIYPLWRDMGKLGINYDTLYPQHIWDLGREWYGRLPSYVCEKGDGIRLVVSKPSIVQESFKSNFWVALASYALKAPWYVWHGWPYVGGWEAIYKKS